MLDGFARLIAEWAVDIMSPEQRECFMTPEGMEELKRMWPEIVNGYFRAICGPAPARKPGKAKKKPEEIDYARRLAASRARMPD